MNRSITFALGVAAVLLVSCARSAESSVEQFYLSLSDGKITEAREFVSKELLSMAGEAKIQASLAKEAQQIQAKGGIKSVVVKLEGKGEIRRGTATITYKNSSQPITEKVKMVKEDGKWKLAPEK